jgi:hypothetical protein
VGWLDYSALSDSHRDLPSASVRPTDSTKYESNYTRGYPSVCGRRLHLHRRLPCVCLIHSPKARIAIIAGRCPQGRSIAISVGKTDFRKGSSQTLCCQGLVLKRPKQAVFRRPPRPKSRQFVTNVCSPHIAIDGEFDENPQRISMRLSKAHAPKRLVQKLSRDIIHLGYHGGEAV